MTDTMKRAAEDDLFSFKRRKDGPPPKPFEHYCWCGQWGLYGYGVNLRADKPGEWFCAEHRPKD
jgi:hypothetical protein